MMSQNSCCVPGCQVTKKDGIPLHHFPNPDLDAVRCKIWISKIGGCIATMDILEVSMNRRVCHKHFESFHKYPSTGRLCKIAIPVLHLPGTSGKPPQGILSTEPENVNIDDAPPVDSPDDVDQSYLVTPEEDSREFDSVVGEASNAAEKRKLPVLGSNITFGVPAKKPRSVKQVLQLRLIDDDGFCDEPLYEVLSEDETEKEANKKQTSTQTAAQDTTSPAKDSPTKEKNDEIEATQSQDNNTQESKSRCENYSDKEYWKLKLKHILHNTQFCGICLDSHIDMNAINDDFEIVDNERTYRKTLRYIVDKVFREDGYCLANSLICNSCTKKLIQSYIFIYNTEETLTMLNCRLNELYNKTCYVCNNSKDAKHSNIYNVVIALDNKVISDNLDSNNIEIEIPETDQYQGTMKCLGNMLPSCPSGIEQEQLDPQIDKTNKYIKNMVLPSYRTCKLRTTHKHNNRCRICLQSYKTQQDLSTHYKTHLKSRCTFCHRVVRDGELLRHLTTRHKHAIHLCTTCNVVFYSPKALERHITESHYRSDYKCVTCLKSLSSVELELHQCRFKCPECEELPCVHHQHLTSYREQLSNLAPRAKCLLCPYVSASKEALIAHVNRLHLKLQPHSCDRCQHKFYCKADLNNHVCTAEKVKKYVQICQYCDKEFSNLYFYKRHEKSCKCIQRKYQCDDCPANFDSSKDQMTHRKLKHGKNTLSCSLCDRVFFNDLKRKRHEKQAHGIQTERSNINCIVCQAKFSTKAALKLHQRYHRPFAKYKLDTLKQFKVHKYRHRPSFIVCEVCGIVVRRILFKNHVMTHSHSTVSCKTCGKSFQNLTLLRYHQKMHLKSLPCPRCKKNISSSKLWWHFRNHLIKDYLSSKVQSSWS